MTTDRDRRSDDAWRAAARAQYDDDTNLAARQAIFAYLTDADPMPAPLGDFSVTEGLTVLDVGCGNGVFLGAACGAGAIGIGVDTSPGMLGAAAEAAPGATLLVADAVALPVADDRVDIAMALWMLYHVDDKPRAAAELRRVTRADGYAVASTNTADRSFLDDLVCDALETVLDHRVDHWFPPLGFTDRNGAAILGSAFDDVATSVGGNNFAITDPAVVVSYVGSMHEAIERENGPVDQEALLTEVGRLAATGIDAQGAVTLHQRRAVFICR